MASRSDTRGPALDQEAVVTAALALVSREGFAALSMRRVAAELGVGTMTLYWHVPNRDDLVDLMVDRAIAGALLDEVSADWRTALAQIARATRDAFAANWWLREGFVLRRLGVSLLTHVEQSIQAVEGLDLPFGDRMSAVAIVDAYVRGYVLDLSQSGHADGGPPAGPPPLTDAARAMVERGDVPRYARLVAGAWTPEDWNAARHFEVGLAVVLDGIAAAVARGAMPHLPIPAGSES